MDIITMTMWFVLLLVLMVMNFIGYFKVPFLQVIVLMFMLFVAVPIIDAFDEYGEIPAIIILVNVFFAAYGTVRALRGR